MPAIRAALLILPALLAPATTPLAAQEPTAWAGFVGAFDAYMEAGGIVGGSALAMRDGRVVARHHVGFADLAAGRRVDERTIFHYGSITKTLNAIAILEGADFDPGVTIPNGGWNAPLDDVAAYLAFLTGPAPDPETARLRQLVLSRETLAEMWEPQASVDEDGTGFRWTHVGLSFFLDREPGGRRIVGHTGSQANFRSFVAFDPERRTAWAMVFNTSVDDGPDPGAAELAWLVAAGRRLLD